MDQRAEPPSWLPKGSAPEATAPAATEETTKADKPADDSPRGYWREGSYAYGREDPTVLSQQASYGNETAPESRHNPSQSAPQQEDDAPKAPRQASYSAEAATAGSAASGAESPAFDKGGGLTSGGAPPASGQGRVSSSGAASWGYGQAPGPSSGAGSPGAAPSGFGSGSAARSGYGSGSAAGSRYGSGSAAGSGYDQTGAASQGFQGGAATPGYNPAAGAPVGGASAMSQASASGAGRLGSYRSTATARPAAQPARRANLVLSRIEPWSVMKFSFMMSLVAWVVLFVAVALLYYTLSSLGVFDAVQKTLEGVTSSQGTSGVSFNRWFSASRVLGYTMLIGAMNVILITAISTVGAMIYNLVTHMGGGIEVTLKESE